ncbi:6515_t:CDS:2 [Cetraspora pellucida]|uniref:6515_t:CDS:1 n=1 Tax=Cetraspora pellucida TaxID=1433469 RepID=A0A9N8Z7H9_9GLOM|nr:6515_t:CDS:2 [Cetraspora pellucida]
MAHYKPYLLEDQPKAPVKPPVNVDLLVVQLVIVNLQPPVPEAPVALSTRPRRKRGPSVINQLAPYEETVDIRNARANVMLEQILQYPDQSQKLAKALQRLLPPLEPSSLSLESINAIQDQWNRRTTAAYCYIKIKNNLVIAILDSDQIAEISMLYNGKYLSVEAEENEENRIFKEFKYKDEMLNEAEGYLTKEILSNESDLEDEPLEVRLKKSICITHLTPEQV